VVVELAEFRVRLEQSIEFGLRLPFKHGGLLQHKNERPGHRHGAFSGLSGRADGTGTLFGSPGREPLPAPCSLGLCSWIIVVAALDLPAVPIGSFRPPAALTLLPQPGGGKRMAQAPDSPGAGAVPGAGNCASGTVSRPPDTCATY